MAQIKTEVFTITVSKLFKEFPQESLVGDDFTSTIETIVQEFLGKDVIVEVEGLEYGSK